MVFVVMSSLTKNAFRIYFSLEYQILLLISWRNLLFLPEYRWFIYISYTWRILTTSCLLTFFSTFLDGKCKWLRNSNKILKGFQSDFRLENQMALPNVLQLLSTRTATEMNGTLHTDFRKSETSRDIKKYCQHHLNIFKSYINFQN